MRNFKNVLTIALFLMGATLFAQTKLSGKVVDENNMALPGADVVIKGTTKGTNTDFDGKFSIECQHTTGTLVISFMGYESKSIEFNGSKDLGTIQLEPAASTLDEIVIVGVADIAKDRQTPVAVSTIKAAEITEKLGTQEFPEILKSTPSVYATKSGGGFGDSRITIRGFAQENIAIMINGVPVNDMENSKVYWSNWAGLSDVTTAMQVQRGLGSSKLAISSVGGTINVLTRTSDAKEGGTATFTYGNDNYMKGLVSYSTGLLDSGLSASVLLSQTQGDGYADGTMFKGNTYFIGIGYKINDDNSIMFTATGAPQWHHQRYSLPIDTFLHYGDGTTPDIKYNNQWGYLDGEEFSWVRNFYHKPVASLNWDLNFNEKSSLSTVIYASWGRGGGSGTLGKINTLFPTSNTPYTSNTYNADGEVRFDDIVAWNTGSTITGFGAPRGLPNSDGEYINTTSKGMSLRASMNSHNWYGLITNYHNDLTDNFAVDFGVDVRTYKGIHYRMLVDPLGADGYLDNTDINNPNVTLYETYEANPSWNPFNNIKDQEKLAYYNDGNVNWLGAFTQLEYKNDKVSAFIQGGISQQGFQRVDYFLYVPEDQKTDWENILGGNVKGGLNYNFTDRHNVYANGGYYSKQPAFGSIFINNKNDLNPTFQNEKIMGVELGYGYRSERATFNLNLYRTQWNDRFLRRAYDGFTYNFTGINELHKGVEVDATYKPTDKLRLNAMVSVGDWYYEGNAEGTAYDDNTNEVLSTKELYLDEVKVGNAAQFTALYGIEWKAFKNFTFDWSQSFNDKLYAALYAENFTAEDNKGALRLPSYSLADAGVSYKFDLGEKMGLKFRFNVNNVFDTLYISESDTNNFVTSSTDKTWRGIKTNNLVNFGYGRTWNASVRFDF
jgi:outer membrane cobalamin receptor